MRRVTVAMCCLGAGLVFMAGCSLPVMDTWHWPWKKPSITSEEFTTPPVADARYSSPPSLPKYVMTPTIKPKDTADNGKMPPALGGAGMNPGMSGMGRPTPGGSYY